MKRSFLLFIAGMICGFILLAQLANEDSRHMKPAPVQGSTSQVYTAPELPKEMELFNEKVPLERIEIREALDRELIYNIHNQGHMLYIMKLSNRFFPIIEERLKAKGLPDDFKYLCVAESNLQNLVSKAGASGFWQFMKSTGPSYDLEINNSIDERYHVIKSTDAACDYLLAAYKRFGNWTAAAASYNCGMGGFSSQAAFQGTNNYYDLFLPDETNKYIFRILTFKHILTNAEALGFRLTESQKYSNLPTRSVTVKAPVGDLSQWARSQGSNYKMVRTLNPWIRGKTLAGRAGKEYTIILPAN
jgi:membrane-bound lytic murein transglycosylase D